jgi:hypothetical protein
MTKYTVIVGNLGTVYGGANRFDANVTFLCYRSMSMRGYGRTANEPVTMLADDDIVREHIPKESTDDI